jgi:two-component system, OmpR family, response regulator
MLGAMRILVVEDEPKMAQLLRRGLERAGIAVDTAARGDEVLWRARSAPYDVLVLDRMLPGMDGLSVCAQLRAGDVRTPVLMLTALGDVAERIEGLDAGADDYLAKPFDFGELVSRVRALSRRGPVTVTPVLEVGDLRLDPAAATVTRGGHPVSLTAKELALLEAFMRHPGQVLSRDALLDAAWDGAYEARSNVVDVYVKSLREKLDRPFGRQSLETVRGLGYRLCAA